MKITPKALLVIVGLLSLSIPTFAADASAPAPTPSHRGGPGALRRMMVRRHLAHKLGLSPEQIAQLKAARSAAATNIKAVRADATLTPEQKRTRVREIVASTRTQMRSVLTPEQQAKFKQLRQSFRHRRGL